jgi:hypothetical protein
MDAWAKFFAAIPNPDDVAKNIRALGGKSHTNGPAYSTKPCPSNWASYMKNVHFWEFINDYLARGLEQFCTVPQGKQLIILGPPNTLLVQGRSMASKEYFETPYQDAALATLWIADYYQRANNVIIFSNQDKVLLAHLLAQPRRIKHTDLHTIEFNGLVAVSRNWTQHDNPFVQVDIGKLFVAITRHSKKIPNVNFTPPVATWVFLFLFCMDSNSSFLPQLQIGYLFRTFIENLHQLELPLLQKVSSSLEVRVNCSAWLHYLFICYQQRFVDLSLDMYDMEDCFEQIKTFLVAERHGFSFSKFKVRMANTFWLFRSMIAAQSGIIPPDPYTVLNKESLYGYEKIEFDRSTGRTLIQLTEDASLKKINFSPVPQQRSRDSSPKRQSSSN